MPSLEEVGQLRSRRRRYGFEVVPIFLIVKVFPLLQEEALCYSSTLWTTLKPEYYPWPNIGPGSVAGVFSPGIVVFKDDLDHDCVNLPVEERRIVSVLTVAAPCGPPLTEDGKKFKNPSVLEDLRGKIRLIYRMAARNGAQYMVLGKLFQGYCCITVDRFFFFFCFY
jgi:hypothetical protein